MMKKIKSLILRVLAFVVRDSRAKVVFYHDVGQVYTPMGTPEELFWAHMERLLQHGVQHGVAHEVAFDDGFRGVWDARDRFREMGLCTVVFLAVGLVGQPGYLTWDEIRTLQDDYGFQFQCHTWSHQTLVGPCNTDLPLPEKPDFRTEDWYRHELIESKAELERQLRRPVTALCFPVGYFSSAIVRRCQAAGYELLYASYPGNRGSGLIVPRCLVQDLSLADFSAVLSGGMNVISRRYRARHEIFGEAQ